MARDNFLLNLRNAYRELFGLFREQHPLLDPSGTERLLKRASRWLSPKSVDGFATTDFLELPAEQRNRLAESVEGFRRAAQQISSDNPPTEPQFVAGRELLLQIGNTIADLERSAWLDSIDCLLKDCETWSRKQDWETKRDIKQLTDSFFGQYNAPVLLIHSPQGRLLVDPIARYVVGGSGVVDLCVMPSFESARIVCDGASWTIQTDFGDRTVRPLNEESFIETAKALLLRA